MKRGLLLFLALLLLNGCNSLFYYPDARERLTPGMLKLDYEDITIPAEDGCRLHAWWLHAAGPPAGTIIHFHGNAENISTHITFVNWLAARGYDVLIFDYRGYGSSTCSPSRDGLVRDGIAVIRYAHDHRRAGAEDLFVLAQSLGGAVAVPALAEAREPAVRALVLESTFASYRKMAREKLSEVWLTWPLQWPLSLLVSDDWSAGDSIARLELPMLFIHGDADRVVPLSQGQALYTLAHGEKDFWEIPGGRHTPAFGGKDSPYREKLIAFFKTHARAAR